MRRRIAWSIIAKGILIVIPSDAVVVIEVLLMNEYQLVKGESSHCIGSRRSFVYRSTLSTLYCSKRRTVVPLLLIGVANPRNAGWNVSCWVLITGCVHLVVIGVANPRRDAVFIVSSCLSLHILYDTCMVLDDATGSTFQLVLLPSRIFECSR